MEQEQKKKNMNFAIRVTDNCNLNCNYCYAKVPNPSNMSLETLEIVLNKIADYCEGDITISWTGGEPMLLGYEFFEKIIENEAKHKEINFINILQTNLTLLDEWFVSFLSNNNFQVRTSLDLPSSHHDELRIQNNFNQTLEKIKLLQNANVHVNINTVITNRNVNKAIEIYQFLKENKIKSFSVSRFILQGNAINNEDLLIKEEGRFGKFLIELFDLWTGDTEEPHIEKITPLDNLTSACRFYLAGKPNPHPCFHCQRQVLAIGPSGDIYPSCNKFFGFPKSCFGNISSKTINQVLDSKEKENFMKVVNALTKKICSNCQYQSLCKGGCYYVAYAANKDIEKITTREQFCKGYYLVFDHIINYLNPKNKLGEEKQNE